MNIIRLIFLAPLGILYGLIALIRRRLYEGNPSRRFVSTLPTICIGNLAVGGTGKTPHVEYLVRLLSSQYRVATLSRGYMRQTTGFLSTLQNQNLTAEEIGDEPMQMHVKFPEMEVTVCEQRKEGLFRLQTSENHPDVVLLDDAYQHLKVRCGLNILLTDFSRPYWRDLPLPAGNLREFRSAAATADVVVVTKSPADLTQEAASIFARENGLHRQKHLFFSTYQYELPVPLTPSSASFRFNEHTKILLLTGIANPQPLLSHLRSQFSNIEHVSFPDHHQFTEDEIERLCQKLAEQGENSVVLTTEKDAMRLLSGNLKKIVYLHPFFAIPIKVEFMFNEDKEFNEIIIDYVAKN